MDAEKIQQMFDEQRRRLESQHARFVDACASKLDALAKAAVDDVEMRKAYAENEEARSKREEARTEEHVARQKATADLQRRQVEAYERIAAALEALASK